MGDLIPGLPDDLATECLIRMHFESFPNAVLTCKKWKHEIGSPEYLRRRIVGGHSQPIVVMTQQLFGFDNEDLDRDACSIRLVVCELKAGNWSELPPIPGYFKSFPLHCKLDVVGTDLVVIGERHTQSSALSYEVYIYSFVSNTWRRGANMMGAGLVCGCVSLSDRVVYVISEFEDMNNGVINSSALAYDVVKDEWLRLPDMETELVMGAVFLKATLLTGKLHVLGGLFCEPDNINSTLCVQSFDPTTSTWSPICKYPFDIHSLEYAPVPGQFGRVYLCGAGEVAVLENGKCQKVADLPVDFYHLYNPMTLNKHLVVIGYTRYVMNTSRRTKMVGLLDPESKEWSILEASRSYSGPVLFACTGEI